MATGTAAVWTCDVCGHSWLIGGPKPTHCASSRCRSRKWDSAKPADIQAQRMKDLLHGRESNDPKILESSPLVERVVVLDEVQP